MVTSAQGQSERGKRSSRRSCASACTWVGGLESGLGLGSGLGFQASGVHRRAARRAVACLGRLRHAGHGVGPATVGERGCNPRWQRAATLSNGGCNPTRTRRAPVECVEERAPPECVEERAPPRVGRVEQEACVVRGADELRWEGRAVGRCSDGGGAVVGTCRGEHGRGDEVCHGEEVGRGWGGACGPARVAISSSTAEVRSSKVPVACPRRGPHSGVRALVVAYVGGEVADGVEKLGVLGRVEGRRVARVPPVDLALRVRSRRGRGEKCGSVASGVGERRVREVRSGESGESGEVRPVGGGRGVYAARAERAPAARRAVRGAPRSSARGRAR
eukprot:scaffold73855_cov63-Phaeocystis_antarctica.AAC.1